MSRCVLLISWRALQVGPPRHQVESLTLSHTPNPIAQSQDWEQVAPPTLKLMPRYADSFKKCVDLPLNFHPHIGVALLNALVASLTTITILGDSQTGCFGLEKLSVAGEEWFWSLTELKWEEFETMDFQRLNTQRNSSLTWWKVLRRYVLVLPLSCCSCQWWDVTVSSSKTNNADMDSFLIEQVHTNGHTTEHNTPIQHSSCKFNFVFAGAASQCHPAA